MPIGKFTIPDWRNLVSWVRDGKLPPHILAAAENIPSITVTGSGLGTLPPSPILVYGNDTYGYVTFGTGTSPSTGRILNVNYASKFKNRVVPMITPVFAGGDTASLELEPTDVPNDVGFNVSANVAPAASQANTHYGFVYFVVGY